MVMTPANDNRHKRCYIFLRFNTMELNYDFPPRGNFGIFKLKKGYILYYFCTVKTYLFEYLACETHSYGSSAVRWNIHRMVL